MKIVVAGASGFIGRMLVPELARRGAKLTLLGRDLSHLQTIFPDCGTYDYENIVQVSSGADLFLNLAVFNNNQSQDPEAMHLVNVHFSSFLAEQAMRAGVKCFVNFCSIHALDPNDIRPYASSKRAGVKSVDLATNDKAKHLYLPTVVGQNFAGVLSPLNALPRSIAVAFLGPLSALKPILPVGQLADWVMQDAILAERHFTLTNAQRGNYYYATCSRGLDIFASVAGLIVLWPMLLAAWSIIKMQGDGPGLFVQKRVGRYGRLFTCLKLRTMAVGTIQAGTHEISGNSVTPLGLRLRRLKIDELPQLWSVLKGDMSLIGPRPCLPSQVELVKRRSDAGVLDVRPGISGLAQVNGIDMSNPEKLVEWDARYVALRGLVIDIKLLLQTVLGGGRGDHFAR